MLICLGKRDCVERIPSGDENPIRTLGDYSRPSHEGYRNTIELPKGTTCGPHDTQYCMEDPEQAFVEYASLRTDEAGGEGYHAVPPPYTGNFMPPRPDMSFAGLDDYAFKSVIKETVTSVNEAETSTSKTSKESMEQPKTVRPSAPIIED
uniref:Uncharacterized protein n=1 Tax=Tanacetum cinerariifolium TaxID=118510 RepID=A0A6L2KQ34_TANCI|nr:hypothetical protein [Tanacetum cinerariifolium]